MISIVRTNSDNADFMTLVSMLDAELRVRDREEHTFYAQFNKIDSLREVVVAYVDNIAVGCGAIKAYSDKTAEVNECSCERKIAAEASRERCYKNLKSGRRN